MTAHKPKPTLTPERIEWFANYYAANHSWGVFHVSLDDGNYALGAAREAIDSTTTRRVVTRDFWPASIRAHAEWFDVLTASQRRRLGERAEAGAGALTNEQKRAWRELVRASQQQVLRSEAVSAASGEISTKERST